MLDGWLLRKFTLLCALSLSHAHTMLAGMHFSVFYNSSQGRQKRGIIEKSLQRHLWGKHRYKRNVREKGKNTFFPPLESSSTLKWHFYFTFLWQTDEVSWDHWPTAFAAWGGLEGFSLEELQVFAPPELGLEKFWMAASLRWCTSGLWTSDHGFDPGLRPTYELMAKHTAFA